MRCGYFVIVFAVHVWLGDIFALVQLVSPQKIMKNEN